MTTKTKLLLAVMLLLLLGGGYAVWPGRRTPEPPPAPEPVAAAAAPAPAPEEPADLGGTEEPEPPAKPPAAGSERPAQEPATPLEKEKAGLPAPMSKEDIEARLATTGTNLEWQNVALDRALSEVAERAGVPLVLTAAALKEIEAQKLAVAFRAPGPIAWSQVLDFFGMMRGMDWSVHDGRIVVALKGHDYDPAEALVRPRPSGFDPASIRPIVVTGAVRDRDGAGVPGAEVFLWTGERSYAKLATAGAGGAYSARVPPPGGRLVARIPGRVASLAWPAEGKAGSDFSLDLPLRGRAGSVRGTVVGGDGKPVADAHVVVGRADAPEPAGSGPVEAPPPYLTTAADGTFADESAPPGTVTVRASRNGFRTATETIAVTAGANARVVLRL